MKRLIFFLLMFNVPCSMFYVLFAQPHVDEAFKTLALAANPEGKLNEERFDAATDSRFSLVTKITFSLSPAQLPLLDMVYLAMDDDRVMCTQYCQQEAYSAHNRPIDLVTPHHELHMKVDDHVNVLWGGFFVPKGQSVGLKPSDHFGPSSSPTLYRYYVLTWATNANGMLEGTMYRITFDADTPEPHIHEPSTPKYQPLLDAIKTFAADPNVFLSRNLSWRRASASGEWTHIHNTIGFNMPLEDETRLLGPLWKAFIDAEPCSYRFLNKPAGVPASDVQIVCDEYGHTVGLGLQSDWNIVYAYFTDEDFPKNRYVYALWYKADVPRQRIVGELIKINTPRPEGGTVVQPDIRTSVPTYLWKAPLYPPAMGDIIPAPDGEGYVASLYPLYATSPDFARMRRILSDSADDGQNNEDTEYRRSFGNRMQVRGMNLEALRFELDTMIQQRERVRNLYDKELMALNDNYRTALKQVTDPSLRFDSDQYNRMSSRERKAFLDQIRQETDSLLRMMTDIYKDNLRSVASHYDLAPTHVFSQDSIPNSLFRRTFDGFAQAYRGDGSQTDATIAERLRQMAEMMAEEGSRAECRKMVEQLDVLRSLAPSDLARGSLDEAIVTLGGYIVTKTRREYTKDGRASVEKKWSYATMDNDGKTATEIQHETEQAQRQYVAKVKNVEDIDLGLMSLSFQTLEREAAKFSRRSQRSVRRMVRCIKRQARRLERRIK